MKKVMIFGTFHVLHPGHLNLIRQAKALGDRLYVVIGRDETVKKVKGYVPNHEHERVEKLKRVPNVDEVLLGDLKDKFKVIRDVKPDIVCLGYDQTHFVDELAKFTQESGMIIKVVRLRPYKHNLYKSRRLQDPS